MSKDLKQTRKPVVKGVDAKGTGREDAEVGVGGQDQVRTREEEGDRVCKPYSPSQGTVPYTG